MPVVDNKSLQSLIDVLRIPPDFARYGNLEPAALSSLDEWKCNTSNVLSEIRNLFLLQTQGDGDDHKLVKGDEGIQDNGGTPPLKELGDTIFAVTPFTAVGEYPWVTLLSAEVAQGTHRSFLPSQFSNLHTLPNQQIFSPPLPNSPTQPKASWSKS